MSLTFKRGFLLSKGGTSKISPSPSSQSMKEENRSLTARSVAENPEKQTVLSSSGSDERPNLSVGATSSLPTVSRPMLDFPVTGGIKMRICLNTPSDSESASAFGVWAMRPDIQADFPIHRQFKPCSTPSSASYRIGASTIGGSGMFALRDFTRGETIMMEQPVMIIPTEDGSVHDMKVVLILAAAAAKMIRSNLSSAHAARYDSLTTCESKKPCGPDAGRLFTNGLPCEFPHLKAHPIYLGLFLDISRCNHSCRPNALWAFDSRTLTMELRALRHIGKDDEITNSYVLPNLPRSERQRFLSRQFSFLCTCTVCTLPPKTTSERDIIVDEVRTAYEMVDSAWSIMRQRPRQRTRGFIMHIEEIEAVIEKYGVETYYNAFNHYLAKAYAMLGDEAKSREWAQRAKSAVRLRCVSGLGFTDTCNEDWDSWIRDPTSSPYWLDM